MKSQKKAMELDPFERPFGWRLPTSARANTKLRSRKRVCDLKLARRMLHLHWVLWEAYRRKGAEKEAAQELEKLLLLARHGRVSAATIRHDFEKGGYKAVLLGQLSYLRSISDKQYVSPLDEPSNMQQLGRREETLALLEEGYRHHAPRAALDPEDPAYDFLHGDERYRSIIRRIGLPPAY